MVTNRANPHVAACRLQLIGEENWQPTVRPSLDCPSVQIEAPLIDVGYGMPHELAMAAEGLRDRVVLIQPEFEPFSDPRHLTTRLADLANRGVRAALTPSQRKGGALHHITASDWRDGSRHSAPLPVVQTSWEDAMWLRRRIDHETRIRLEVNTDCKTGSSWNVVGAYASDAPNAANDAIMIGSHHDTTPDSLGANDNGAGVAVLLETARLVSGLGAALKLRPPRPILFVSFGAEEQRLQGSTAFVERHFGSALLPRLMIALDELATGSMKGVVLQFPELRSVVQRQLDALNEGLRCHVLTQIDASGDMFPFTRRGIPSAFLWRWRFHGRHPEANFGHSPADTRDKVRIRELKEYVGFLARLVLRLAYVPSHEWPDNALDAQQISRRIEEERGTVFRTM